MVLLIKYSLLFIAIYLKLRIGASIVPVKNHKALLCTYKPNSLRNHTQPPKGQISNNILKRRTSIFPDFLKAINKEDSRSVNNKHNKDANFVKDNNRHVVKNAKITRNLTFRDALVSNRGTLIMASLYIIRIFKSLVMARTLLETLLNINPYLPPFNIIYDTTDFYIKMCNLFPEIMGINIFGEIPWFVLGVLERYLNSLLSVES